MECTGRTLESVVNIVLLLREFAGDNIQPSHLWDDYRSNQYVTKVLFYRTVRGVNFYFTHFKIETYLTEPLLYYLRSGAKCYLTEFSLTCSYFT